MFIWKDMENPEKKIIGVVMLVFMLLALMPSFVDACSCIWKGPFLSVARDAPLVIIGKLSVIIRVNLRPWMFWF